MSAQFRTAAAVVILLFALQTRGVAESPQRAFASDWEGRTVVLRQPLYSLVYNERGNLGQTYSGRRDGLLVLTPQGVFFEFRGRQHRDDVRLADPRLMVQEVAREYEPDSLDVRSYRKIEPVTLAQYDPGGELSVRRAEVLRDGVRLTFAQPDGPDGPDAPVSSLTVRWPTPLSKSFSERAQVEALLRQYVEPR